MCADDDLELGFWILSQVSADGILNFELGVKAPRKGRG